MNKSIIAVFALLAFNAAAHTQAPGLIENDRIYKEVNSFEFTVANRNSYVASYDVIVGDYDAESNGIVNEKVIGTITNLQPNEAVKFDVDFRVAPNTTREALMCTEMVARKESQYRSRVCSKVVMKRR